MHRSLRPSIPTLTPPRALLLAALAAAVSALVLAASATGASTATEVEQALPDLKPSEEVDGPVIAEGTLRDSDGEPLAGDVVAYAHPSERAEAEMAKGQSAALKPVARAKAGEDGAFTLRADPSVSLDKIARQDADAGAIVDFRILGVGAGGDQVAHHALPRSHDAEDGWGDIQATEDDAEDDTEREPAEVELDARPHSPEQARAKHEEVAATGDENAAASSGDMQASNCTVMAGDYFDPVWVLVGEVNTSSNTTGSFTYQGGSSSELGVGVSSGSGWESSGTLSKSSSSTVSYPGASSSSHPRYDTQFQYREYTLVCPYYYEDFAEPERWIGGSRVRYASGPPTANNCTPYASGSSVTVDRGRAVTWTNGVKMAGQIGIDLSSQTGHTTSTSVTYNFSSSGNLCGTNDYPFDAARMTSK